MLTGALWGLSTGFAIKLVKNKTKKTTKTPTKQQQKPRRAKRTSSPQAFPEPDGAGTAKGIPAAEDAAGPAKGSACVRTEDVVSRTSLYGVELCYRHLPWGMADIPQAPPFGRPAPACCDRAGSFLDGQSCSYAFALFTSYTASP